jgi:hypothetical protein
MNNLDIAVDHFVQRVNGNPRPRKFNDEVALSVAEPSEYDPDEWSWSIRPYKVNWISEVEARLPRKFPEIFRSLVTRYIFPEFEWGEVLFFANTPETIGYPGHELRVGIFRDARLFETLSGSGYLQFGQPSTGSYDPVCFAPSPKRDDAAVVRIDHEDILINGKVQVVETIAQSFLSLIRGPVV